MKKKAIIIGSTGLIGNYLLNMLLKDEHYERIIALVRKPMNSNNEKLTYVVTNFNDLQNIESQLKADCLFICIGSTMAKAGSKEAFLKVDYNIPVNLAGLAIKQGVKSCVVVSSMGANADSSNFYLQTKGKMEQAIEKMGFQPTIFMRPSLLFGTRDEFRLGELIGKFLMKLIGPLFLGPSKKYRGIEGETVAKAMVKASLQDMNGILKYESDQIELLVK